MPILGGRMNRNHLQQIADLSGGAAYFPVDVTTLAGDYHKILDELRRRYVIAYESTNRARNVAWRKVNIHPKLDGVEIRSRDGYFAPQQ